MRSTILLASAFVSALGLLGQPARAQAQTADATGNLVAYNAMAPVAAPAPITATAPAATMPVPTEPTEMPATVQLTGKVLSPSGRLPGAVVTVTGTKLKTVTNENGEFSMSIPASSAPLSLTTSYAGFADETVALAPSTESLTLSLTKPQVIKVARRQQLNAYLKTARKQVKKQVKRARKAK